MEPGGVRAARERGPRRRALLGAGPPRWRDSDPRALLPLRHRVPGPAATAPGADRRLRALRSVPRWRGKAPVPPRPPGIGLVIHARRASSELVGATLLTSL